MLGGRGGKKSVCIQQMRVQVMFLISSNLQLVFDSSSKHKKTYEVKSSSQSVTRSPGCMLSICLCSNETHAESTQNLSSS